jgi:superfamily II RNA helicase
MVKICPNTYPSSSEEKYKQYFEKYPFPLSSFQKYALEAIVEGHHILVTAHTGSGKTLPAEFSIEHFVSQGKKVIYTSPIKALSNQKFHEFGIKYPHISFGILTGDIKCNPEASVLIMTTEILMNTLYMKCHKPCNEPTTNVNMSLFEMDFENELACVIFDEVHYINDQDRGKVWEETIMMLPKHVQMVMLSATIDAPEKFALWCESGGVPDNGVRGTEFPDNRVRGTEFPDNRVRGTEFPDKQVYLTTTHERVVPLTHYAFITCTNGIFKAIKDKTLEAEIKNVTNTLHTIQDAKGKFEELNFLKIKKTLGLFESKNHFVKRQHVLNTVTKHMVDNAMLPAICFVLSRKALEQCASDVTTVLLEDDSKVPYIVQKECEQILRKLPNYQEYLELPEYVKMVSLLEKGIGIHHAGIMPVLREMVELLFSKGYIKLLFATETFAVGINMPTKTVLFTDVNKFDGSGMRMLMSHEYTQMAGRAGRRGIDTVGHVIHLPNLYKDLDMTSFKTMMKGKPQRLTSKFKISYNLLLNLVDIGETNCSKYAKRSMIQGDIDSEVNHCLDDLTTLQSELQKMESVMAHCKTPKKVVDEYIDLKEQKSTSVNKKKKDAEKGMQRIVDMHPNVEKDVDVVSKYNNKLNEIEKVKVSLHDTESYLDQNVERVLKFLMSNGFVEGSGSELTLKGHVATFLREVHCLVFAELILNKSLTEFEPKEIVAVLSCFTNISVPEDVKSVTPSCNVSKVNHFIKSIQEMYLKHCDAEISNKINTGFDYSMHFDLVNYVMDWCDCDDVNECKLLLQTLSKEKEVFLGEFVKSILKINNISSEMEKVAEYLGDIELLHKLKQIPTLTMKFVATNQSLYV